MQQHRAFLNIQLFQKPADTSIVLTKAVLAAMISPATIYDVGDAIGPDD